MLLRHQRYKTVFKQYFWKYVKKYIFSMHPSTAYQLLVIFTFLKQDTDKNVEPVGIF